MLLSREKTAFYLKDLETPLGKAINLTIAGLVLLSSVIFVAETYNIPDDLQLILNKIDNAILVIFSLEYLLRLWSAENKIKYILSLYSIIDLMAILPSFLPAVDISFLRLLRWFRILRLIRFIEGKFLFTSISTEDGVILARIIFTLFAIIFQGKRVSNAIDKRMREFRVSTSKFECEMCVRSRLMRSSNQF